MCSDVARIVRADNKILRGYELYLRIATSVAVVILESKVFLPVIDNKILGYTRRRDFLICIIILL